VIGLFVVTKSDQGFVERCNGVKFIQYDNNTLKSSWILFAQSLELLCGTVNFEFFCELEHKITRYNAFIIPSY